MKRNTNSLGQGAIYMSLATFIFIVSGYATNIWLGRYFGPVGYGIYGVIISLITAINLFQTSGIPQAVTRFAAREANKEESVLRSSLVIQSISTFVLTIIYLVATPFIGKALNDVSMIPLLRLSALIIPAYGLYALYFGYYGGVHQFGKQARINIIFSIVKIIGVISLGILGGVRGVIIGFGLAPLLAVMSSWSWPKNNREIYPYKDLILFSLPLIGFTLFTTLQQGIDLFVIKSLIANPEAAGYYTAVQNVAKIPYFALGAMSAVIFSGISRSLGDHNEEKTQELIQQGLRYTLIILVPLVLLISADSKQLISLFYSSRYEQAAAPLALLVIGFGFLSLFNVLNSILVGAGKLKFLLVNTGLSLLVTTSLCLLLIPRFGLLGAAGATTMGGLMILVVTSLTVKKLFRVFIGPKRLVKILTSSLVIYTIARILSVPTAAIPLEYLGLATLYLLLLVITGEINIDDWRRINRIIPIPIKGL